MSARFAGKRAWVTGAGRGIGRAVAQRLVEEGAQVIGIDVAFGADAAPFRTEPCDVADGAAVAALCARLIVETGGVDVLVHAAGVLRLGGIAALSEADWRACMDVNAGGAFHLLRALSPHFMAQRSGAVVAVASNAGHVPRIGMAAYGASKAALSSLIRSVGLELAPYGVRCNLVSPGSTDTDMLRGMWADPDRGAGATIAGDQAAFRLGIPLGKLAAVDDIASAVLFLASDAAGHIVLHDMLVDGGATLGA